MLVTIHKYKRNHNQILELDRYTHSHVQVEPNIGVLRRHPMTQTRSLQYDVVTTLAAYAKQQHNIP